MNLLAKSLGQLAVLAVALFFFSCEDPTSLGYQNPNRKFNVQYVEIPLSTSVVIIDSVITDNKIRNGVPTAGGAVLVGRYDDAIMGTVKAESFLQIYRAANATKLPSAAVFDSVTFQMKLNFYSYGFTGVQTEKFTVHEITGDSLTSLNIRPYYSTSTIAYNPNPLGEVSVQVDFDTLKNELAKPAAQRDTLIAKGRLSDAFGQAIFGYAQADEFKTKDDIKEFVSAFKGISLVPSESNAILGLDISSGFTRIFLHYHTATDTLQEALVFSTPSFTNIQTDRSATALAGITPYQSSDPGDLRYIQSGSTVFTRIDLQNFYDAIDTLDNALINSAEFVIENVESPTGNAVHDVFVLRILKENNQFANYSQHADRTALKLTGLTGDVISIQLENERLALVGRYFNVLADNGSMLNPIPAALGYSSAKRNFTVFATLFAQRLFKNKDDENGTNENRIKYLALFPASPNISSSVNRTVFNKNNIKLRITYTRPTNIDL